MSIASESARKTSVSAWSVSRYESGLRLVVVVVVVWQEEARVPDARWKERGDRLSTTTVLVNLVSSHLHQ